MPDIPDPYTRETCPGCAAAIAADKARWDGCCNVTNPRGGYCTLPGGHAGPHIGCNTTTHNSAGIWENEQAKAGKCTLCCHPNAPICGHSTPGLVCTRARGHKGPHAGCGDKHPHGFWPNVPQPNAQPVPHPKEHKPMQLKLATLYRLKSHATLAADDKHIGGLFIGTNSSKKPGVPDYMSSIDDGYRFESLMDGATWEEVGPASLLTQTPAHVPASPRATRKADKIDRDEAAAAIADALSGYAKTAVSECKVRRIVSEMFENMPPREVIIKNGDAVTKLDGETLHPRFEKVLRLVSAGLNVLLVGPAGSGKTHLAAQVAKALDMRFASISCTAGASESQLVGRFLPTGDSGRFEYHGTSFIDMYETGGVFLFDELDAADPNMLLIVNSALANGGFYNDLRRDSTYVTRHPKTCILAAANTFGTGADMLYTGRSQLDAATLDRWYVVDMDYDPILEAKIAGADLPAVEQWQPATTPSEKQRAEYHAWVLSVRRKVAEQRVGRVASTRMLQKGLVAMQAGVPYSEVCRDVLAGWTRDELAKVGAS